MKRPRDSQRSKCYAAEDACQKELGIKPNLTLVQCRALIQKLANEHPAIDIGYTIQVKDGRGCRRAWACTTKGSAVIKLPRFARTKQTVIHEFTHIVIWLRDYRAGTKSAAHGWQFCAEYLDLVEQYISKKHAATLRKCFKDGGVKHKAPVKRKRQLTDEQKAELAERLKKARAAKAKKQGHSNLARVWTLEQELGRLFAPS